MGDRKPETERPETPGMAPRRGKGCDHCRLTGHDLRCPGPLAHENPGTETLTRNWVPSDSRIAYGPGRSRRREPVTDWVPRLGSGAYVRHAPRKSSVGDLPSPP